MKLNVLDYLKKDIDISSLSNFKTQAKTKYYYEIHNRQDLDKLLEIYNFSMEHKLKILLIWWGTNLLFAFDLFDWIIVKNCLKWYKYDDNSKILEVYTSEFISDVSKELYEKWQILWKRFIWLPWSFWWAIYWNAWCFWLETESNFVSCEVFDFSQWSIDTFSKDEMNFEYRSSKIKNTNNYFIISALFDLSTLKEKYSSDVDNIYFREHKQPKGNSCGSFFKNPSKENSAWKLIEQVWLKWRKIWWAYFSELHANFLISDWTATYSDLLELIKLAKNEVYNKYDIELIPEVRIITN